MLVKSESDQKEYELLTLPCGLEVLMVSTLALAKDPKHKPAAAAALSVQVGSFSDPVHAEGTAHFLEHMVFMGSKKYPEENCYDAFVSSNGGYCNAFTESEYTCYQFEVQPEAFEKTLDIFAACFHSPLLSPNAVDREVEAIESEFNLALNDDSNRLQQLLTHECVPDHPYARFSWGNKRSLVEVPRSQGIDMIAVLRDFHRRYYYPANMKLVVVAPLDLRELRRIAEACFQWPEDAVGPAVPFHVNPSLAYLPPLPNSALGRVVRLAARKKGQSLVLTWMLPPQIRTQLSKPCAYLAHLLGHEGEGSLLHFLQKHSLAHALSAGVSDGGLEDSSFTALFVIQIKLSRLGLKLWMVVAQYVWQYLQLLREAGPQKWIYDELRDIAAMAFRFEDDGEAADIAEAFSILMLPFYALDRSQLLRVPYAYDDWQPETIQQLLSESLLPERAHLSLLSSKFAREIGEKPLASTESGNEGDDGEEEDDGEDDEEEGEESEDEDDEDEDEDESEDESESEDCDDVECSDPLRPELLAASHALQQAFESHDAGWQTHEEPHFGVKYQSHALSAAVRELWQGKGSSNLSRAPFHLPPPNPFIARCFDLYPTVLETPSSPPSPPSPPLPVIDPQPQLLLASSSGEPCHQLFFCLDQRLQRPKLCLYLHLSCADFANSPLASVMTHLVVFVAREALTSTLYMASMAELHCQLFPYAEGITIKIHGFEDKAWELASCVLQSLLQVRSSAGAPPSIYDDRMRNQRCVDLLHERYHNELLTSTKAVSKATRSVLSRSLQPLPAQMQVLSQPLPCTVADFLERCLPRTALTVLVQGNALPAQADTYYRRWPALLPASQSLARPNALPVPKRREPMHFQTNKECVVFHTQPLQPKEVNSAVEILYSLGPYNTAHACAWYLAETCLSEPFFDQLRTKRQLGYLVHCGVEEINEELYLACKVVSATHSLEVVLEEILRFVHTAAHRISTHPDERHLAQQVLPALLQERQAPVTSLRDAADRSWARVMDGSFNFARRAQQVQYLHSQREVCEDARQLASRVRSCVQDRVQCVISLASTRSGGYNKRGVNVAVQRVLEDDVHVVHLKGVDQARQYLQTETQSIPSRANKPQGRRQGTSS